jgi:hypothetical protein
MFGEESKEPKQPAVDELSDVRELKDSGVLAWKIRRSGGGAVPCPLPCRVVNGVGVDRAAS